MSIRIIGCLDESEGQVRIDQVLPGQVRTGKSKTDSFPPPLFFGKIGSKGGGEVKSNTTDMRHSKLK